MLMKKTLLLITFFTLCLTFSSKINSQSLLGRWDFAESTDGSEYIPRDEGSLGIAMDKLILLGGRGEVETSVFDLKEKVWLVKPKPPLEMHHFQAVSYNDRLYILGALTGKYPNETPIPNIYIYNPIDDSWTKGPEIPKNRRRGAAGATLYKEKIYLICGITNGHTDGHVSWMDEFDPKTGKWTILPDAPRARDHFSATVLDNQLYVLGGRKSMAPDNTYQKTIEEADVFKFNKKEWYTLPEGIPTMRAGTSTVALGKYVVTVGGESASSKTAHIETEAYDTKKNKWIKMVSLIEGRHGMGAVVYKNKIYIAGGNGNRGAGLPIETMEVFTLKI